MTCLRCPSNPALESEDVTNRPKAVYYSYVDEDAARADVVAGDAEAAVTRSKPTSEASWQAVRADGWLRTACRDRLRHEKPWWMTTTTRTKVEGGEAEQISRLYCM